MKTKLSKKAFTLVELIGVIIVLAIIGFVIYPTVNKIIIDNKQDILNNQIQEIERIAANWAVNNDMKLTYENGYSYYLYLDELYEDKYINEQEVYNPFTNEKMQGCVVISWYGELNKHTYTYDEECKQTYPPSIGSNANEPNDYGWYNEDILVNIPQGNLDKYTYCISDEPCEPNIDVETDGGQVIISTEGINYLCVNGTNEFGPTETICDIYRLDKTDPVIGNILISGTQGLNEWYVSNVDVSYTESTDELSGILSEEFTPGEEIVNYDTEGITYTLTVMDKAGNVVSTSETIKVDVTKPEAGTLSISGTKGSNNWYTSDVTFTINDGSDETSGHSSTTSNLSGINTNTAGTTVTVTTSDNAGNTNTRDYLIKVDKTKPTVGTFDIVGTLGSNGWYTSNVTISGTGGSDDVSGPVTNTVDIPSITTNTKETTITLTTTNQAGLTVTDTVTIKVDKDKPVLTAKDGPFEITEGDNVDSKTYFNTPTYSISDEASYTCSPVNTSGLTTGTKTITCTATGGNGLTTTASVSITVKPAYSCTTGEELIEDATYGFICVKTTCSTCYTTYSYGCSTCGGECTSWHQVCATWVCTKETYTCNSYSSTNPNMQGACGISGCLSCSSTCTSGYYTDCRNDYCQAYAPTYSCGCSTGYSYYCPSGYTAYSGSGSSLKCYRAADQG